MVGEGDGLAGAAVAGHEHPALVGGVQRAEVLARQVGDFDFGGVGGEVIHR